MTQKAVLLTSIGMVAMVMAGCFPGDGYATPAEPAGFFLGIWHGWIAPISLVVGMFKEGVRVYEVHNAGWFYDFGFYMAVISGFGSLSLFRKEKDNS